jgi:hypothetical protein
LELTLLLIASVIERVMPVSFPMPYLDVKNIFSEARVQDLEECLMFQPQSVSILCPSLFFPFVLHIFLIYAILLFFMYSCKAP